MTMQTMGLADFVKAAKAHIKEIDSNQLESFREQRADLMILDIREPAEIDKGIINGAMAVPRGMLEAAADYNYPNRNQVLVEARERPVVLYCASGGRSAMAAVTLQLMGYREVYSLAGGVMQWQAENRPLQQATH